MLKGITDSPEDAFKDEQGNCIGCGTKHGYLEPCPDGTKFLVAMVECRICTKRHCMIIPVKPGDPTPTSTECLNCGNMACDIVGDEDGEK